MKNLLYKEFCLSIHPLFYLVPLFGALLLIPQWPFFIALMYFQFITVPNVFTTGKAQNDIVFSVMLPVRKRDVVRARIMTIVLLELLQIVVTAGFAVLHMMLYKTKNFLMEPNFAFFGFTFMMYAVYNVIFFPMFYKTAYKVGVPVIVSVAASMVFFVAVEIAVLTIPAAMALDGMTDIGAQLWTLAAGIVIFALFNLAAYAISARRFERLDL